MKRIIIAIVAASALHVGAGAQQQTLTLSADECRAMAIESSMTLRRADLAVRQAELDRKVADVARLPKIDGSASGIYLFPDMDMMGMTMEMKGAYVAGLQLTQPIYAGGKITAGRRLARIGETAATEQRRADRAMVAADALRQYWTYVAVLDKVRLTDRYHAMIDTIYAQTEVAVEAGMATDNDLLRIRAKRSEIAYQQKKAANGAELCRLALCNSVGVGYDVQIVPADSVPDVKAPGALNPDISARPELALLRCQVDASRQQAKMVLGDFLPTVGLSVGYNWYGNIKTTSMVNVGGGMMVPYTSRFQDNLGMAMLAVRIPIFHWGEGAKKVRKAKLEVQRAQLELDDNARLLELEAHQAGMNLDDGWGMIATASESLAQADENLRVMTDRYEAGMSSLTDLLDAQNQWHQAHSDMIEATTQYRIYLVDWQRATGTLE